MFLRWSTVKILELQEKEWRGVFISHLQSIGSKLGLNFVWNDCIMGSLERLEFDWNGKQCLHTRKIHHGWLDYEELQGRKGTGFGVMLDIGVKRKQNTMVQVKEKSKKRWGCFLKKWWYERNSHSLCGWSDFMLILYKLESGVLQQNRQNRPMPFPAAGFPALT